MRLRTLDSAPSALLCVLRSAAPALGQAPMVLEEETMEVSPERPEARYLLRHTHIRSTGSMLFPEVDAIFDALEDCAEGDEGDACRAERCAASCRSGDADTERPDTCPPCPPAPDDE